MTEKLFKFKENQRIFWRRLFNSNEKPAWWRFVFFLSLTLMLAIIAIPTISLLYRLLRENETVTARGRQRLDFSVVYHENSIFEGNPSLDLGFLMSYTDHINVISGLTVDFSHRTNIYYSYQVEERLVIRHMGSGDANLNSIVYQNIIIRTEELTGRIDGDTLTYRTATNARPAEYRLTFGYLNDGTPGGRYIIEPIPHIKRYFAFLEDQGQQMRYQAQRIEQEQMIAQGFRGFSAEIWITFTYSIRNHEDVRLAGLNETSTYGFRMSLTTEIYSMVRTGRSNFTTSWETNPIIQDPDAPEGSLIRQAISFVALFIIGLIGVLFSIKKVMEDNCLAKRKADIIQKKYSREIVFYEEPLDLSGYTQLRVNEFNELLKMAINLSKHIMCHRDDGFATFAVIVDANASVYEIDLNVPQASPPPSAPVPPAAPPPPSVPISTS